MGWWDRYEAWQPEASWDRFQAWRLGSRARWVATGVGLNTLIVLLYLWLFTGSSLGRTLLVAAIFSAQASLLWWFWYYPRAKAKSERTSVPVRTQA